MVENSIFSEESVHFQFNLTCATENIYDPEVVNSLLELALNYHINEKSYFKLKSNFESYGISEKGFINMLQIAKTHPQIKIELDKRLEEKINIEKQKKAKLMDDFLIGIFIGVPLGAVTFFLINYLFFGLIFKDPGEGLQIFISYLVVAISAILSSVTINVNRFFAGFFLLTNLVLAFYFNFIQNTSVIFFGA